MAEGPWTIVGAVATALGAILAAIAFWVQGALVRRQLGVDSYMKLEDGFYRSDRMIELRARAASQVLARESGVGAFQELADFYDYIGIMVRRRVLDEESAWSSFYRRAAALWELAGARSDGFLEKARGKQELRWNEYGFLVNRLSEVHARVLRRLRRKKGLEAGAPPTKQERHAEWEELLEEEASLSLAPKAVRSMAGGHDPAGQSPSSVRSA